MDDLISRQAAIKLLEEWAGGYSYLEVPVSSIEPKLNELPYVDLSEYCDKLWKTAYERGKRAALPRKGEWVHEIRHYKDETCEFDYQYIYCSECGEQRRIGWNDAKYCPNCGSRMVAR